MIYYLIVDSVKVKPVSWDFSDLELEAPPFVLLSGRALLPFFPGVRALLFPSGSQVPAPAIECGSGRVCRSIAYKLYCLRAPLHGCSRIRRRAATRRWTITWQGSKGPRVRKQQHS